MQLRQIFIIAVLVLISYASFANEKIITLVYTGNLDGELEPCGCSEGGNKGGIRRQTTMIDQLRKDQPDLIFVSSGGLLASEIPQDKIKSDFILTGLEALQFDAIGVQWRDLAYGTEYLKQSKIPLVLSNWRNNGFANKTIIKRGDVEIAFFSWLDPKEDPAKAMANEDKLVSADTQPVIEALRAAKQHDQITILATTLTLKQIEKLFPDELIDIALIKSKYEKVGDPTQQNKTLVLQPGSRGMRFGKVDITVDDNNRIKTWSHAVYEMPDSVADAPRLQQWYDQYNAKLKEDYQARVEQRKALMTSKSPYASAEVCETCHKAQYEKWTQTPHSGAFYKLQDVNKAFDPFCVGCHTLGYEKDGGFIDNMLTPKLAHVQCENCHGPSRAHADDPKIKTAFQEMKSRERCAQCHVQKHSPDFVFEKYWPIIAHGTPRE